MNLSPILLDGVTVQITKQLESRIDSRQMAEMLDVQHDNFMQTLEKQESSLKELGVFLFQTGKPKKGSKGGRPEKYLLLNENQAFFAITLSRNTPQAVKAKLLLVKAFAAARNLIEAQHGYTESQKQLHQAAAQMQQVAALRVSSAPPFTYHCNFERLNNKLLGVGKEERNGLNKEQKTCIRNFVPN